MGQMNERILELIQLQNGYRGLLWTEEDKEEFAESIIRECADIASDVGTDTVPTDFALDKCYEIEAKILENFGLK